MNFIGHFYHALEQKGRLAIPKSFRKALGSTSIVTRGLESCLFLFPDSTWTEVVAEATNQPFTRRNAREWVRLLANNAHEVDFDPQGRILIPEHLRDYASLTKDCVVAGSLNRLEIWDRDHYHTYMDELEQRAEAIAESIGDQDE